VSRQRLGLFVGSAPIAVEGHVLDEQLDTPWGLASQTPLLVDLPNLQCVVMKRHGAQSELSPHQINYRANLWLMKQLGVGAIVATHTVGSIDPNLSVGQLVLPHNLIDYTWGRGDTFDDQRRHIEFSNPYDENLRSKILQANPSVVDAGVYACTQGPRLETAAEIARLNIDGCTLVGMTGMPEAALARELEIAYASVCLVVNPAAGVSDKVIDMTDLRNASVQGAADLWQLVTDLDAVLYR